MDKLIDHKEKLETPMYRPCLSESLKQKHDYFEVQNIDSKITRQNNPHFRFNKIVYK